MPVDIGWSEFAIEHFHQGSGGSYTVATRDYVVKMVEDNWESRRPGAGETDTDRKVLVPVPPKYFFCPPMVPIDCGIPLRAEVITRQDGESPHVDVFVTPCDVAKAGVGCVIPATKVDVVCYSAEALEENGGVRDTFNEWEIVALLCRDEEEEEPMEPLTMARNFLEKFGGTSGDYSADEFAEAIWYWAGRGIKVREARS